MKTTEFLAAYETALKSRYVWTADAAKLARFLASCAATLGGANSWAPEGEAVVAAWRAIGGKGKPTLKSLRALDGSE